LESIPGSIRQEANLDYFRTVFHRQTSFFSAIF
jgi:hypothetical protein